MRLSFVIPTRNQADFIRQCIDSCIAQAVAGAEIIVVDGGSTDGTQAILESYGDRISYVSEPDRGQSDAINKGIRRASGDVIAWINSDDYYADDNAIRRMLDFFDPSLDIVYGDGLQVDVNGRILRRFQSHAIDREADILIQGGSFVMQPALLFRRQLYLDVGGVDESLHFAMDYDLWLRMFARARATRYVPTIVACARYHADAKSIAGLGKQIDEVRGIKMRGIRRLRLGPIDFLRVQVGIASLYAYWLAVRTGIRRAT